VQDLLDAFDKRALAAFRGVDASIKADGSPITRVDHETTEHVHQALQSRFPDYGVLGEEKAEAHLPGAARQWVVDPLDGTAMFARGLPVWGIGMGLMEQGVPVEGYLSFPVIGERYACVGDTIYLNGAPAPPPREPDTRVRGILVGSDTIHELPLPRIRGYKMRNFGTNLYHLIAVAMGHAEAMISPRCYLWDLVPALPFTRARGLVERYLDGSPLRLDALWAPERRQSALDQPLVVGKSGDVSAILRDLS
jgi:fructose-1,6-bisphosphatase/inositol monophosphatase family enzyme